MSSPNPDIAVSTIQKYVNGPVKNNTLTKSPLYYWVNKKGETLHNVGGTRYSPQGLSYSVQAPQRWSRTQMGSFSDPVQFKGPVFDFVGYMLQYMTLLWDKLENQSGDTRRFDREKEILKATKKGWMPFWESKLWVDESASAPPGIIGLAGFMKATGTYGGLDLSTSYWGPTSQTGASGLTNKTFATDPMAYIVRTLNTHASKGTAESTGITDRPSIAFTTQAVFEFLQSYITAKSQLPITVRTDEAGINFDTLRFSGVDFFWSPSGTSAEIDFINPEDMQMVYRTGEDIEVRMSEPDQPLGELVQQYTIGLFCCTNPYNQARLHTVGVT